MRTVVRNVAVVLVGLMMPFAVATAQEPAVSPVLLKRIAEAVDGNRTGRPVWVVARYDFPNLVAGVYNSRTAAEAARPREGKYGVFGPYVAEDDGGGGGGCPHDGDISRVTCPDTIPAVRFSFADVRSMTLTLTVQRGARLDTVRMPFKPTTDAIFLTLPALDKFVFPYYERILGPAAVAAMRDSMSRRLRPR